MNQLNYAFNFSVNGSSKNIAYDWGPWSVCSSNGYMTRKQICDDTNCEAQEMQCYFFGKIKAT